MKYLALAALSLVSLVSVACDSPAMAFCTAPGVNKDAAIYQALCGSN
jgi:hypothetical protein